MAKSPSEENEGLLDKSKVEHHPVHLRTPWTLMWQGDCQFRNLARKGRTETLRVQSSWTWTTGIRPSWEQVDGSYIPKAGEGPIG